MTSDLVTLIGTGGEVCAVKDAMVAGFRAVLPKAVDVYYGVLSDMEYPCVCVGEVQITPNGTFGGANSGMETMVVTISVFTSASEERDAQRLLDALLGRKGPIRSALWAMRGAPGQAALSGAADDLVLFDISGYGQISIGDDGSAYGANLSVRVIVS